MEQLLLVLVFVFFLLSTLAGGIFRWVLRLIRERRTLRSATVEPRPDKPGNSVVNGLLPNRAVGSHAANNSGEPSKASRVNGFVSADGGYDAARHAAPVPIVALKRASAISRVRSLPPLKQAIVWSELLSRPVCERDG